MTDNIIEFDTSIKIRGKNGSTWDLTIKVKLVLGIHFTEFSKEQLVETIVKDISKDLVRESLLVNQVTNVVRFEHDTVKNIVCKAVSNECGKLVDIKSCDISIPTSIVEWDIDTNLDTIVGETTIPVHLKAIYQGDCDIGKLKVLCQNQINKELDKLFDIFVPIDEMISVNGFECGTAFVIHARASVSAKTMPVVKGIRRATNEQKVNKICIFSVPVFGLLTCLLWRASMLINFNPNYRINAIDIFGATLMCVLFYFVICPILGICAHGWMLFPNAFIRFIILSVLVMLVGPLPPAFLALCS